MALSVADQLDIQALYSRYAHYIDEGRADAWADLFTPDGSFRREQASANLKDLPVQDTRGTENLRRFAQGVYARQKGMARHWTSNLIIEGAGREASVNCYAMLIDLSDQAPRILVTAKFQDKLVKTPGGWKFQDRLGTPSP